MRPETLSKVTERLTVNMYALYTRHYSRRMPWLGGLIEANQVESYHGAVYFYCFVLSLTDNPFSVVDYKVLSGFNPMAFYF